MPGGGEWILRNHWIGGADGWQIGEGGSLADADKTVRDNCHFVNISEELAECSAISALDGAVGGEED